jgi:predicted nucleic acid-binding protein
MLTDTDILIDYLRGERESEAFVESNVNRICLSAITVAELYQGVKGARERGYVDALVSGFTILPITEEIAREAGLLCKQYRKSHGSGLADCLVAATALLHSLPLRSLNLKHFPMVEDAEAPYRKQG